MLNKEKKEQMIVVILIVVFVASFVYNKHRMTPKPRSGTMTPFADGLTDVAQKAGDKIVESVKKVKVEVKDRSAQRNPIKLPQNIAPKEKKKKYYR